VDWNDTEGLATPAQILQNLGDRVSPQKADLVMGLTARPELGAGERVDYRRGMLVVRVTGSRDETALSMARGFGRLFGALPVTKFGTLMGRVEKREADQPLSAESLRLIRLHIQRPFGSGEPLPAASVDEAIRSYEAMKLSAADPGELLLREGLLKHTSGDLEGGVALYARGLALTSRWSGALIDLERIKAAVAAFSMAESTPEALMIQGKLADLSGRRDDAAGLYLKALEQDTTAFGAHYGLGVMYLESREWGSARDHLEAAVRLDKTLPSLYLHLGDVYLATDRASAARWAAREALKVDPGLASGHGLIAQSFLVQRKTEEAEAACEKALEIDPTDGRARMAMAQVYIHKGRGQEAIEEAKLAVSELPHEAEAFYTMGNAYMSHEEFKSAAEAFRKAVDLSPNHAKAHTHLAIAYYNMRDLDQALDHAKKGLSLGFTDAKGIVDAISNQISR